MPGFVWNGASRADPPIVLGEFTVVSRLRCIPWRWSPPIWDYVFFLIKNEHLSLPLKSNKWYSTVLGMALSLHLWRGQHQTQYKTLKSHFQQCIGFWYPGQNFGQVRTGNHHPKLSPSPAKSPSHGDFMAEPGFEWTMLGLAWNRKLDEFCHSGLILVCESLGGDNTQFVGVVATGRKTAYGKDKPWGNDECVEHLCHRARSQRGYTWWCSTHGWFGRVICNTMFDECHDRIAMNVSRTLSKSQVTAWLCVIIM